MVIIAIYEIFCILFQRPTVEVHPVQNDRFWLWISKFIVEKQLFPPISKHSFLKFIYSNV